MIGETEPSGAATERIRELNDLFRSTLHGGQVVITAGVQALELLDLARLIERVRSFSDFTEGFSSLRTGVSGWCAECAALLQVD